MDHAVDRSREAADSGWEAKLAQLWASMDDHDAVDFVRTIDHALAELPPGDAIGLFERGAARDSSGRPEEAIRFYRAALEAGLAGQRRRRANIQMASSLRNHGMAQEAVRLLRAEAERPSDELDGAVSTFLALALADLGREREALAIAIGALSGYLPRYSRSVARYAQELTTTGAVRDDE